MSKLLNVEYSRKYSLIENIMTPLKFKKKTPKISSQK